MLDAFEQHLRLRRKSPSTIRLRVGHMRRFERGCDLVTATEEDLLEYIDEHDWKPNTRASVIVTFRVYFAWALKTGRRDDDPAAELESEHLYHVPGRVAAEEAIHAGLARANWEQRAMILLGAESGLRVNEIATLHMDNREGGWLRVLGKGSRERLVPISPELGEMLDYIENAMPRGHYFSGAEGRHYNPATIYRHITSLVGCNPHALRRRAATVIYNTSGHDLRLVQEFLGHSNPSTTAMYVHIRGEELAAAAKMSRIGPSALFGLHELGAAA